MLCEPSSGCCVTAVGHEGPAPHTQRRVPCVSAGVGSASGGHPACQAKLQSEVREFVGRLWPVA